MITVREAKALVLKNIPPPRKVCLMLKQVLGHVLAEEVRAPFPMPIENNSAMDGFVVRAEDCRIATRRRPVRLKISGRVRAGDGPGHPLRKGHCFRIMTGAFLPKGGDAVIPKERAFPSNGGLHVDKPVLKGAHVRMRGEEIKQGDLVLSAGCFLSPAALGLLANLGRGEVSVFEKPKVSLVVTGNELMAPGQKLKPGKIFDSNSWAIRAALDACGFPPVLVKRTRDDMKSLTRVFKNVFCRTQVVIFTGGVSVGDYDFVKEVLGREGVRPLVWRVSQKPGKPIYVGRKGRKLVFGLPGNPAAAFTCFYEYVLPALRALAGFPKPDLKKLRGRLLKSVAADAERFLFLKGRIFQKGNYLWVEPLAKQGSHMLSSLVETNGLIRIPPGKGSRPAGCVVTVDRIPGTEAGL